MKLNFIADRRQRSIGPGSSLFFLTIITGIGLGILFTHSPKEVLLETTSQTPSISTGLDEMIGIPIQSAYQK